VWSTASTTVSLPLAIAVSVVVARSLGPHGFARFALLSFLVPLLLMVTDLGVSQATTRSASRAVAAGDLDAAGDLLGKTLGWNLLRLPLVYAMAIAIVRPSFVVGCVLVGGLTLLAAASGLLFALHAENRGAANAKLTFLQGLASGIATITAAAAGAAPATVWVVSFVSGVVAVPGWLFVANPSLRRAALTPRLPRQLPVGFWRYGVTALTLAVVTTLVFSRSEIVVLQVLGEQHALAVFALAFGLAQRLTTPIDTLLGPLVPALSALAGAHPERTRAGFGRALRLSATAAAFMAAAAAVGTMLAAPVLFGPQYKGTGAAFAALAAVSLLQSAGQPFLALGQAMGRPGGLLAAYVVALVVDIALSLSLIPPFGLWGAVVANAAGGLTALALSVRANQATSRLSEAGVPGRRLLVLTTVSCAAAYLLGRVFGEINPALGAAAAFAVGTGCFVGLARLSGGLLAERDAAALLDMLPRRLVGWSRSVLVIAPEAPPRKPEHVG
jgi:O-antigen/teichoic acid export membrane protein